MEKVKPQFLYRGVILNEEILKNNPIFGIDLVPPHPPKYDEQGRKIVGDGNEYGVYMSDYKAVATEAYAAASISHGTPLNDKIRIGDRKSRISIPAVGIVYKISTNNLDVHIPWITSSLRGHYNNGYIGDEWIAERIPANNYVVEQVVVGPDILHQKKEIVFDHQEEIMSKIELEINERKKRLEMFEKFIETLPINDVLRMSSIDVAIYQEIFKKDGLIEINLDTFVVSKASDCIKMLMAYLYQSKSEEIPMNELRYLNSFNVNNITFLDINKKLLTDLNDNLKKREEFVERKKLEGKESNTKMFDNKIEMISKIMKLYHKIILNQAINITGISIDEGNNSITDLRKIHGEFNKKLEELYYNGDLTLQLYQEMRKVICHEIENLTSIFELDKQANIPPEDTFKVCR